MRREPYEKLLPPVLTMSRNEYRALVCRGNPDAPGSWQPAGIEQTRLWAGRMLLLVGPFALLAFLCFTQRKG